MKAIEDANRHISTLNFLTDQQKEFEAQYDSIARSLGDSYKEYQKLLIAKKRLDQLEKHLESLRIIQAEIAKYESTIEHTKCEDVKEKRSFLVNATLRQQLARMVDAAKSSKELIENTDKQTKRSDELDEINVKLRNEINMAKGAIRVFARVRCWLHAVDWKYDGEGLEKVGQKETPFLTQTTL